MTDTKKVLEKDGIQATFEGEGDIPRDIPSMLAGQKITLEDTEQGVRLTFDDKGTGRVCGTCTLCCKLMPVPQLGKIAGERCKYQRAGKGCTIYKDRPGSCMVWSCRWLSDRASAGMPRPDKCHYTIDMETDAVVLTPHGGGEPRVVTMLQVWLDPAFPDAWDEPHLRAYMAGMAEKFRYGALIRTNSRDGFAIFPPALTADRQWHYEHTGNVVSAEELDARVRAVAAAERGTVLSDE
jgi:hypothetical protein